MTMNVRGPYRIALAPVALVLALAVLASGAAAQSANPGANTASAPNPASPSLQDSKTKSEPSPPSDCTTLRPESIQGGNAKVVVELDPSTIWRPRQSEVRFVFNGSGIAVQSVQACFAWSGGSGAESLTTSPLVRAVTNAEGKIEYGATVPTLASVHVSWFQRIFGETPMQFTGLFVVPVARMQIVATVVMPGATSATQIATVLPVGVTSVWYGIGLTVLAVVLACLGLYYVIADRTLPGTDPVLKVIATKSGYASLSQFQIILWTLVVGAGAVYVMALSGNLIAITNGTLVLLGIAGVTTILARVPTADSQQQAAAAAGATGASSTQAPATQAAQTQGAQTQGTQTQGTQAQGTQTQAAQTSGTMRAPKWSDLVVVDSNTAEIDVTRVQMLIFTAISAVFVGLKVLTSYEIPEIPEGYLALMGISNGVYLTGKHVNGPGR